MTEAEVRRRAWRASGERKWQWESAAWQTMDDGASPIQEVWLSLPSRFFGAADCLALLRACRKHAPKRELRVLTEYGTTSGPQGRGFRAEARKLRVELIDPRGRKFSPWLRDPFLLASAAQGERVVFCRPNEQPGREDDSRAARLMMGGSGITSWARMPMTFHGGNLVHTPGTTWISAHSVQERVFEMLGRKTLRVGLFQQAEPWRRYAAAVDGAARELAELCRRPVRFVHPWPVKPTSARHRAFVESLAGGSGFDLDTLVTILPASLPPTALVGDLALGSRLLPALADEELTDFARRFRITRSAGRLRRALLRYQKSAHGRRLDRFVEMVAKYFHAIEMRVVRTPLLLIPTRLIADKRRFSAAVPCHHFPLGFSNVVVETTARDGRCAEGFGSGLATLDRAATKQFAEAGYALTLYPPLAASIICGGGYRCATQEIRTSL